MINWKEMTDLQMDPDRRAQFLFLLAAGVLQFLLITVEGLFSGMGYFLTETYILLPSLLFFGSTVSRKQPRQVTWRLGLSAAMVAWFIAVQIQHKLTYGDTQPLELFFPIYLMAFPFGAVTEDGERNRGLNLIAGVFLAASLVLVGYAGMLLLDCVPQSMAQNIYWDGTRLHTLWHANICACVFMIGIGFCMSFFFQTPKTGWKVFFGLAAVVQFLTMALTNCRTSILMTCAMIGGTVFFAIWKGGWKRFLIGLAAALVVMAGTFTISGTVYDLHTQAQVAKLTARQQISLQEAAAETTAGETAPEAAQEQASPETQAPVETVQPAEPVTQVLTQDQQTGEITITGNSGQGTLSNDLKTLNGRTGIWRGALTALENEPALKWWGTEYVGLAISVYNAFPVEHAHNSWMQVLMQLGIPGLAASLVFTALALCSALVLLWRRDTAIWKKIVAMMELCILVAGFLEPYLFISGTFYHFINFIFFFCLGYLDQWRERLRIKG